MIDEFIQITKALTDGSRVRALMAVRNEALCLCQIIDLLDLAPSTVSKHMAVLSQAGLVTRRKEGRWHFYRAATHDASPLVASSLSWLFEALEGSAAIREDARKLDDVLRRDLEELSACYRT